MGEEKNLFTNGGRKRPFYQWGKTKNLFTNGGRQKNIIFFVSKKQFSLKHKNMLNVPTKHAPNGYKKGLSSKKLKLKVTMKMKNSL